MNKPEKRHFEACYTWSSIERWISHKYGKDLRNFAGTKFTGAADDPPYHDLWHWVTDNNSISNGCFFYLPLRYDDAPEDEQWVAEALALIHKEFADEPDDEEIRLWVSW